MKNLMMTWIATVAACSGPALLAQDITGTWQGTLQAGRELRTVIKISQADAGFKAVFYSIDQGGQPITASSMTLQGTAVKMAISSHRASTAPFMPCLLGTSTG